MSTDEVVKDVVSGVNLKALTWASAAKIIVMVLVGIIIIRILTTLLDRLLKRSRLAAPIRGYLHTIVRTGLWFVLVLVVAESLGIHTTSLIALFSVAGLAVSLALQNTLSNLAGGLMILVSKPFSVGDFVETEGVSGTVAESGLSYSKLITIDNKTVFLPNSQLAASKIINYTAQGRRRVDLNLTASYDAPTQVVKDAILEAVAAIPQVHKDPAPVVRLSEYQSSSIQYVVRVWTDAADYWNVYYDLLEGVRDTFDRHGVEMTYDHLNVHLVDKQ